MVNVNLRLEASLKKLFVYTISAENELKWELKFQKFSERIEGEMTRIVIELWSE